MRLWDLDDRFYKYIIDVSVNNKDWEIIVDKSEVPSQSWQDLKFEPRPVVYIRITGVDNTINKVSNIYNL